MTDPTLILEAAFGGQPGSIYLQFDDATRGLLDTGIFAPSGDGFIDLTSKGRAFTTARGRSRALEDYAPGRCTIIFSDADDSLDPNNLSGPYVSAGATEIVPMVPIRIRATCSGTTYPVWQGFADSWTTSYPGMGKDSICTVAATDAFKALGLFDPAGPSAQVGASELSGTRIGRVLDNAGWLSTDRDLNAGISTLQATPLAMNALQELQGIAASEQGYLFIGKDGKVAFRSRHSRITDTRSKVSQADFGNHGVLLGYSDIALSYDDTLVKNKVSGTILGGTVQSFTDSLSVGKYLGHTYNGSGLWLEKDADALAWCKWVGEQYLNPELRVDSITLLPRSNTALWPVVLGLEIGDLVTVSHLTPAGSTIARNLFVEGIAHNVKPGLDWVTTLSFSSATFATGTPWLVFDDSSNGKLDTGVLAAF